MKLAIIYDRTSGNSCRARCPALPGCVEYGRDRHEAGERIARAIEGYIASMNAQQPLSLAEQVQNRLASGSSA